jgi:hypothetical protein
MQFIPLQNEYVADLNDSILFSHFLQSPTLSFFTYCNGKEYKDKIINIVAKDLNFQKKTPPKKPFRDVLSPAQTPPNASLFFLIPSKILQIRTPFRTHRSPTPAKPLSKPTSLCYASLLHFPNPNLAPPLPVPFACSLA